MQGAQVQVGFQVNPEQCLASPSLPLLMQGVQLRASPGEAPEKSAIIRGG